MQKISFIAIFLIIGLLLNTSVIANGQYSYNTSTASGSALQINQSASPTDIQRFVTVQNNNVIEITQDQCINGIEKLPIDVVFSIDSSNSMQKMDPQNMRLNASVSFVDMLNHTYDKAGMVTWGGDSGPQLPLSSDFQNLKQTILSSTQHIGDTNYNVGLESAISILDSNPRIGNSSEVIIFLSDGEPNQPFLESGQPGSPVDKAREKGYKIYTIGLGIQKSEAENRLKQIAQNTGGEYFASPSSETLDRIFHSIFLKLTGVAQDKGTVTMNIAGGGNVSTHSYPIDVVYALDATTSMGESDPTNERIEAAQNFTDKLLPSTDKAGVVAWDQGIDFTIPLTNDLQSIKTGVTNVDSNGDTDINMGLAGAISLLDKASRSSPDNNTPSTKVIIIITDGKGSYLPSGSVGSLVDQARVNGYTIFSIGVGVLPGTAEESDLINMATSTGGNYYFPPNAQNLQAIFDDIYKIIIESNIPRNLDLSLVTQNYITVNTSSFTIPPDLVENDVNRGHTMIKWHNISKFTGNFDKELSDDETFTVSYSFGLSPDIGTVNSSLPIIVEALSDVTFNDQNGNLDQTFVPQLFVNVETIKCNPKEILPQINPTQDENQTKGQFKPVFNTFIVPGSHNHTLGVYEERNSTIFEPLETIEYYLEFVNFTQKPVKTFSDTTQYTSNFTGYFEMINSTGQVFNYTGLPEIRYQDTLTNKSSYWFQSLRSGLPLDEGNYTMNFEVKDNLANESFVIKRNLTIDEDDKQVEILKPEEHNVRENNDSHPIVNSMYRTYQDPRHNISIEIPNDWIDYSNPNVEKNYDFTTITTFRPNFEQAPINASIGLHILNQNISFSEYSFDRLNSINTNGKIKNFNETLIFNKPAYQVHYTIEDGTEIIKFWIMEGSKVFHITFIVENEEIQTLLPVINKIAYSFRNSTENQTTFQHNLMDIDFHTHATDFNQNKSNAISTFFSKFIKHENKDTGFVIEYPYEWNKTEYKTDYLSIIELHSPQNQDNYYNSPISISISARELENHINLNDYINNNLIKPNNSTLINSKILESGFSVFKDVLSYSRLIDTTLIYLDENFNNKIENILTNQTFMTKDDKLYEIKYKIGKENHTTYLPLINKIISTFKIK